MAPAFRTKIFISYSRRDEYFARCLAHDVEDAGADVWIDVDDIPIGSNWSSAIQEGLRSCDVMLLIMSPSAMSSRNVEDEWQYFLDKGKPVIPLYWLETELHFQLRRLQYVDFRANHVDYDKALQNLVNTLDDIGVHLGEITQPLVRRDRFLEELAKHQLASLEERQASKDRERELLLRETALRERERALEQTQEPTPKPQRTGCLWRMVFSSLFISFVSLGAVVYFNIFGYFDVASSNDDVAEVTTASTAVIPPTLRLTYDENSLFVENLVEEEQDISDLRFIQTTTEGAELLFEGSEWINGGRIQAVPKDGCYQVTVSQRFSNANPSYCNKIGWVWRGFQSHFWVPSEVSANTFQVYLGEVFIANCPVVAEGECDLAY